MAGEGSAKERAWVLFDRIVADAAPGGTHTNPWVIDSQGRTRYEPDFDTLARLLGVPLYLDNADSRTGVPALALDVWLSYELRRAGFDEDATWPRAAHPRILPMPIASLLKALPARDEAVLRARLTKPGAIAGVTSSSASILGKNYFKQVDVIMADWATGPELLISTKRMDSSYGKNAANRVEESYGDAKNLRLRHPLAALGFVFALRSDILVKEPDTAEWLKDLLAKLGREDDAYHATCLIMIEYDDAVAVPDDGSIDPEDRLAAAGVGPSYEPELPPRSPAEAALEQALLDDGLAKLPVVTLRHDEVPGGLSAARFLATMVDRVLDTTPVNLHAEARARRRSPAGSAREA